MVIWLQYWHSKESRCYRASVFEEIIKVLTEILAYSDPVKPTRLELEALYNLKLSNMAADSYSDSKNQFVKEMSDFFTCRLLQEICDNSREETDEDLLAQLNIVSSARKLREFHKTDRYIRDFDQIINSKVCDRYWEDRENKDIENEYDAHSTRIAESTREKAKNFIDENDTNILLHSKRKKSPLEVDENTVEVAFETDAVKKKKQT
ncbi:hypothetical protein F8M41_000383 [Gigaspora margarita]|uniref:Uncharacterized protein n=1 Tax=Gigaspora margarita TaxID=4874 RepID=A0A8H3XHS0_GIGMA|nr:hypothetical protein F8M41_000383 [Gigaspora margarita]